MRNLTQKNTEKNLGFFYNHTPKNDMDASFNFSAEYRQDISGQNGHDGVALGFNYIKKLNTNNEFIEENEELYRNAGIWEDASFQQNALELGFKSYVDPSIFVGHEKIFIMR